jgi:hypothetical protein
MENLGGLPRDFESDLDTLRATAKAFLVDGGERPDDIEWVAWPVLARCEPLGTPKRPAPGGTGRFGRGYFLTVSLLVLSR